MRLTGEDLRAMINEELSLSDVKSLVDNKMSKNDVRSMMDSKISSIYSSNDFKKAVKGVAGDVIVELFKILWQRSSFFKSGITN
jgi:hypothetical protein